MAFSTWACIPVMDVCSAVKFFSRRQKVFPYMVNFSFNIFYILSQKISNDTKFCRSFIDHRSPVTTGTVAVWVPWVPHFLNLDYSPRSNWNSDKKQIFSLLLSKLLMSQSVWIKYDPGEPFKLRLGLQIKIVWPWWSIGGGSNTQARSYYITISALHFHWHNLTVIDSSALVLSNTNSRT